MRKITFWLAGLFLVQLLSFSAYSQINSGSPTVPFGSVTSYDYGIMPATLPTTGEYGRSQAAADQYNFWVTNFVEKCSDGTYRVKFDTPYNTVSEGIAYGMLLSVYAGDKERFDGFWKYFQNSMNHHGLMNWMTDGCNGNARDNAATDADLDAAHALIIASEQWPNSSVDYIADAKTLIDNIQAYEMDQNNQNTLNGDEWYNNNCLNPSYQSPAYYKQYALVDVEDADFWNKAADAASSLLLKNRNSSTGLVGNWCDASGVSNACANTTPNEYGSDACRNPWRMATDILWHGADAVPASSDISSKLAAFVEGHESNLRGPMQQNVSSPENGSYKNGSYTTFALASMVSGSSYQGSLDKCYSAVAGLSHDYAYFNETVHTLTLFVLTGNFWKPGTSGLVRAPEILRAETNEAGTEIKIRFTAEMKTPSSSDASSFSVSIDGSVKNGAVTGLTVVDAENIILTVTEGIIEAGKDIELNYAGGSIESVAGAKLADFTGQYVKNSIAGNSSMIDDCEDGNAINFFGGAWFTYDDHNTEPAGNSTVAPVTSPEEPLVMVDGGADGSSKAVHVTYTFDRGQWLYEPFVGIGTTLNPEEEAKDLTGSTGISFWHKGNSCIVQPQFPTITDGGAYAKVVPESLNDWQFVTLTWDQFVQPDWAKQVDFDLKIIDGFNWHIKGESKTDNSSGEVWIDQVQIEGLVPTAPTAITVAPTKKSFEPTELIDTFSLEFAYTPIDATLQEVIWSSSDESIATVNESGNVKALAAGIVNITATSKFYPEISSTCEVTIVGEQVDPTGISLDVTAQEIKVGEDLEITATIEPAEATDKTVSWETSDGTIVSVDASGLVTGLAVGGPVTITAKSNADETIFATAQITVIETPVEGIDVDKETVSLQLGESETVTATVTPVEATNKELKWETSNDGVVTVVNGVISSQGVGDAVVTVSSVDNPSVSKEISVTVSGVSVTDVVISETAIDVEIGRTVTLTASVEPAAAPQTVKWSSEDDGIATVSGGIVSGVAEGQVVIKAESTEDGTVYAECTVTVVPVQVSDITISKKTADLYIDETLQLSVTIDPVDASDKTVTWKSSNENVATVDADGLVTPVAIGNVTITATTNDGSNLEAESAVSVIARLVKSITLNTAEETLNIGDDVQIIATEVLPANATDKSIVWSTSDVDVVTVDNNGLATATGLGSATITATANDGSTIKAEVAITVEAVLPKSVTTTEEIGFAEGGDPQTLTATVLPANADNKEVVWSSSDESVATVDPATGEVTPVGLGECEVVVKCVADETVQAVCKVTVSESVEPVTGVTLDKDVLTLTIDEVAELKATVAPADATNKLVTWKSSDESVATVENGVVTAVALGDATITVTTVDGNFPAECQVTVATIDVTGVELDQTTLSLSINNAPVLLTATVAPANATNQNVTWKSSDEDVVTVSATGLVTVVGLGDATVTVTTEDQGEIAECAVTISDISVSNITLTIEDVALVPNGATATITAVVEPEGASNKTLTWESSDETIATVTNGVVTPLAEGTVTITATANDGSNTTETISVEVKAVSVIGVELNKSTLEIAVGKSEQLDATILPAEATNTAVTWSTSDDGVATVSNGIVTSVAEGTATITVTTDDGEYTATCEVTVKEDVVVIDVKSVALNKTDISLQLNETETLTATFDPTNATNKNVTWTSSDEDVVTVSDAGVVTPVGEGTATITVKTEDGGFEAECSVEITAVAATNVVLNKNTLSLGIDEDATLEATVTPSAASQDVEWMTSDETIATVDANGKVVGVGPGKADITAKTLDGTDIVSAACEVTVSAIDVTGVTVDPTVLFIDVNAADVQLTATVEPANAFNKNVSWSVNYDEFVTVTDEGVVSPVALGKAVVTVTTEDAGFTAKCNVEVVDESALVTRIDEIQTIHDDAEEGTDLGVYKPGSKADLQTAIDAAEAALGNSSQEDLDATLAQLESDLVHFNKQMNVNETVIFDAEMANMTYLATYWFSFNDSEANIEAGEIGESVITPLSTEETPFTMTEGGANGTGYAAKAEFTLDEGTLPYDPFVGMGMPFNEDKSAYDLSASTGIAFTYKSDVSIFFEVALADIADAANYYMIFPSTDGEWSTIDVSWDEFEQYSWGTTVEWDAATVTQIQWKVQKSDGTEGELWVDDVIIKGTVLDLPEIDNKTVLTTMITKAKGMLEDAVEGTNGGEYPVGSKVTLLNAVEDAQEVVDMAAASADDIADAEEALQAAIDAFTASVIVPEADKDALDFLIGASDFALDAAVVGNNTGEYPDAEHYKFYLAIKAAKKVYDDADATQADVDAAEADLTAAKTAFENSVVAINDAELLIGVYPNPCVNTLNVNAPAEIVTITIATIGGKVVSVVDCSSATAEINVAGFAAGAYTITVEMTNGKTAVDTFVK